MIKFPVRFASNSLGALILCHAPAWAFQVTPTSTQDSGTIAIGRSSVYGGSIVRILEHGGTHSENIINNFDTGRQIQCAVRDSENWNPTQAGDGPHSAGCEVYYPASGYTYSRSIPLLFYNPPIPASDAVPADTNRFHMWTEFLPGSGGRAFTAKIVYENWSTSHPGLDHQYKLSDSELQFVNPVMYTNGQLFDHVLTYSGLAPWTGAPLNSIVDPDTDLIYTPYRMTENWSAIVDSSNWGLACMSTSGEGNTLSYAGVSPACGSGPVELQDCTKISAHDLRFELRQDGVKQVREARCIYWVGDVDIASGDSARTFFQGYKPNLAGNLSDSFDSGLYRWDLNSNFIQVANDPLFTGHPTAVRMFPCQSSCGTQYPRDLSLLGKAWRNATYQFKARFEPGSGGMGFGLAFRKPGEEHHIADSPILPGGAPSLVPGGYTLWFEYNGSISIRSADSSAALGSATSPVNLGTWHTWKLVATDSAFDAYVDGASTPFLTATDTSATFKSGYCSLIASTDATAWFDDFSVTATGDSSPPPGVINLQLTQFIAQNDGTIIPADVRGLRLSWSLVYVNGLDYLWTRVVRKSGGYPQNWRDGDVVYEGLGTTCDDLVAPQGLVSGQRYYYKVFRVDHAGNWNNPASGVNELAP